MKVVAWVPIKMNNERLPGKNVLPLGGKPLCQHVLGELLKLDNVDDVYAFCSEPELDKYLPDGVERIPRDESLNSFSTKINDVILAFSKVVDADIYVYAQVTSPFLKKDSIEKGLKEVLSGEYDSALSVKILRDFLWKDKTQPLNYDPSDIARTQDLEPYYQETGGFYIYRKELIQKENRRTGHKPYLVELSEIESVDIDYREDYELAQSIVLKDHGRVNDIYNIKILNEWCHFLINGGDVNYYFEEMNIATCAIYGMGVLGKLLYDILKRKNIKVSFFIDRNKGSYNGVECLKVNDVFEQKNIEDIDAIIITPGFDMDSICTVLKKLPIRLVSIEDIFEDEISLGLLKIKYESTDYPIGIKWRNENLHQCNIAYDMYKETSCVSSSEILKNMIKQLKESKLVLPLVDLVVTTKCSLRCKKCFHLIPEYNKNGRVPFDVEIDIIEKDLKKILSATDFIIKVNILGGEPFLHTNFCELLDRIKRYKNVGYFRIVSNATVIPSDEVCEMLKYDRFIVDLSDYGLNQQNVNKIIGKFEKYKVSYSVSKNDIWYDFGKNECLNLTETQLVEHYNNCFFSKCKALMMGELHTCAYNKHGVKTGILPDTGESLRIHDYSNDDLREEIIKFYNKETFDICKYCNAPSELSGTKIKAAEQEMR